MNIRKVLTAALSVVMLTVFTAGTAMAAKAPKPTVSSLTKQLNEANDRLGQAQAQNVSLTARVKSLEEEVKKAKKQGDTKFMTALYLCGGIIVLAAALIFMVSGKPGTGSSKKRAPAGMVTKEDHFADIEAHVLDDWQNILFHPDKINMKLYGDLKNHFPQLLADIEEWKTEMTSREKLVESFSAAMSKVYPSVEVQPKIYLLTDAESEPFIEDNTITDEGSVCARAKAGNDVPRAQMQAFLDAALKMMAGEEFSGIKNKTSRVRQLKDIIDVEIRKIKHNRKLPGNCDIAG